MPSSSAAQARLMAAVAHGWKKPGGGGPPVKVAKEFNKADAARGSPARRQMIQKAQAKMLRKPKVHAEPDVREPDSDADDTSTKFKRTGSISSAGASVGGGT